MFTFKNRMLLFWSVGLIATKTCERKTEKVTIIVVFTIAISQYQNWIEPHPQCQILLSLQNCRQAPHLCLYREPPPPFPTGKRGCRILPITTKIKALFQIY